MLTAEVFIIVYLSLFCLLFSILFGLAGYCDAVDTRDKDVFTSICTGVIVGAGAAVLVATLFPLMIISMLVQKSLGVWR
jgi:hypothetical protein